MREIVLDTETTGLNPCDGDRIVEIGAVELMGHVPTGRTFHQYINPQRPMAEEAFVVHGLGDEFLSNKPTFAEIGQAFLDFIGDAKLVIHNAAFDMGFLNHELKMLGMPLIPDVQAVDTLHIARNRFPGAQNSLDALCRRFGVDNSVREKHGALLDSELLADVYLELLGGRQPGFGLASTGGLRGVGSRAVDYVPPPRPAPLPGRLTDSEKAAHAAFVQSLLGDEPMWLRSE